ncbi:hypothetical protein [Neobacillus soli]|nr:hypothetical protein [Neobacillus soli]
MRINEAYGEIWLGVSKMGRPVYKKFGFTETDEFLEFFFKTYAAYNLLMY